MNRLNVNGLNRRHFLSTAAAATACAATAPVGWAAEDKQPFHISLAQWSLNRHFFGRGGAEKLDPLDFPVIAKQRCGIDAVEYVNQFYFDVVNKPGYVAELKKRAEGEGVKSLLIMCDREGNLGDPDTKRRITAVRNHLKWLEWAKELGCHSIRVNAASDRNLSYREQQDLAVDGLSRLCELADTYGLNVIVENHGGLSSHGRWLRQVMERVDHPRVGTLPDFGNFYIQRGRNGEMVLEYDRYLGTYELMPFAKGVSAKSHEFDDEGNEVHTDYERMMKIVLDSGFDGYVGVEFEGSKDSFRGIELTKSLLERIRDKMAA
jgi:sugar phosphate isomerase/epimerase